jgi:stress response protein SCP2
MAPPLARGANTLLRTPQGEEPSSVRVELAWAGVPPEPVVLTAVACDSSGRSLSPAHHISYDSPSSGDDGSRYELAMDLAATPADLASVFFLLSVDRSTVHGLASVTATLRDESGAELARYPIADLPATAGLVVVEVYRRSGQWKVRAIGQGHSDGRSGLLRSFGLA